MTPMPPWTNAAGRVDVIWFGIALFTVAMAGGVFTACVNYIPTDRPSSHAVYLRDRSGDCVAIFAATTSGTGEAMMEHVNAGLCR